MIAVLLAGMVMGGLLSAALITRNLPAAQEQAVATESDGSSQLLLSPSAQQKLGRLRRMINQYYYKADDLTTDQLEEGLYKGLLKALDDRYSVYYTADEYKKVTESITGQYCGIGAYLSTDLSSGYPKISGVMEGSPAQEAGLRENDIIYEVDGMDIDDMELDEVVSYVRGEEGTDVVLTIVRSTEYDTIDVTVTRRVIDSPTVESKVLDDQIGYLRIASFDTVTTDQFTENLESLYDQNIKGLIIDLRGNPGGDVDVVTAICNELLPEGLVFYMEERSGERTDFTCDGKNEIQIPLAVLVNGNSASAAEIMSGAIQDAGVGTVIGTQTYGKGVVQGLWDLPDGSAVKITVGNYFTRDGHNINGIGITPDVELELDAQAYLEDGTDNQLDKAIEIVKKGIK